MCKAMVEKSFCVVRTLEHFAVSTACAGHSVLSIEQLPAVSCVIRCGARALFIIILLRSVGDGTAPHIRFFPAPSGRGLLHSVARTRTQDRSLLTEHTQCVCARTLSHLPDYTFKQQVFHSHYCVVYVPFVFACCQEDQHLLLYTGICYSV